MARTHDPLGDTPLSFGACLRTMATFGIATGYAELGYHTFRKYHQQLFIFQTPDVLWMTPLSNAILFSVAGILGWAVLRASGRSASSRQLMWIGTVMAGLSVLFLFAPLHKGAAILIAVGAASAIGRSRLAPPDRLVPVHRFVLPALLALLATTATVLHARRAIIEKRGEAHLSPSPDGTPNVLIIILDTVRAWNLSLYGYPRPTTPHLARRAEHGVRFAQAFTTAPWTLPSHASIFTGREAHELGANWYTPLDDSTPTVAEAFRASGYRTGGFVANLPYTSRETGLDRGFLHYDDYPVSLRQLAASASLVRAVSGNDVVRSWIGTRQLLVRKDATDVTGAFLDWIDEGRGKPFFAFLNYYDAHQPYVPPPEFLARFLAPGVEPQEEPARRTDPGQAWDPRVLAGATASYDASIAYLDEAMERLLTELEDRGLLENTLVILTSDHGEEFGEHGLIDHGSSLNRAALQVPLVVWFGNRLPGGTVVPEPVSLRDIPATLTDLVPLPGSRPFPGRTLCRYWSAYPDTTAAPLFSELRHAARQPQWYPTSSGDMLSVIDGDFRYIRGGNGAGSAFALEDTMERKDLTAAGTPPPHLTALRALLDSVRPRTR